MCGGHPRYRERGYSQEPIADLILTNGKIVTVDDRFTIAQAVAIKGECVIATGKIEDISPCRQRRSDLKPVIMIVGGKIVMTRADSES